MRVITYTFAAFAILFLGSSLFTSARADDQGGRASLNGSWVQSGGRGVWIIKPDGDSLHVTQMEGASTVADYDCKTDGENCAIKVSGHKATESMYYNGNALVQLETKGGLIVKRRFSVQPSGNEMKVEVTPMTEKMHTEELEFERTQLPVAKQ